ncbi:HD domain-containing phosphohydrolase [Rhodoferax sp. GW822-FHT02A01]|uniref:HD-GYP domain-containing protein n=1 Tax=Rhodoferax sp. GW822-FHT02A01 TaxID=3141537 RepID=UPI00315DED65
MTDSAEIQTDSKHFTRAVTDFGERKPVLATAPIFNDKGIKVAEKGVAINADMYERLMQHRLSEPIENLVSSASTVDGKFLRETAENLFLQIPFLARMAADAGMRELLLDVVSKISLPAPIAFQVTLCSEVQYDSFIHGVQVALISAWLAKTPTSLRFDVGMAATVGLVHDLGMLHLDPVLLQPEQVLSRTLRRQLYTHPLISAMLLKRHHEFPKEAVRAVEEHHESLNGSGYPRNLAGDAISPSGRILGLAAVVAAMFSHERRAPEMRLSVLLRMNMHRYDSVHVERVMRLLRPDQDAANAMSLVLEDPVRRLMDIEDAIAHWPSTLMKTPGLSKERLYGLNALAAQTAQLQRALATVGVAREQLVQIGDGIQDDIVKVELSLLAIEAAWQLRSMARQTRRRWHADHGEAYPDELQSWLDRVDDLTDEGSFHSGDTTKTHGT